MEQKLKKRKTNAQIYKLKMMMNVKEKKETNTTQTKIRISKFWNP